ncbi:glycerol-3-phosphate acyltransferase [Mucisphaera sp.]|uniref:glycerol-3-phosphate acyltransferase n=1 Tax=Mucisphaera sp. TaxID=2913024 RepID=UPI003D117F45
MALWLWLGLAYLCGSIPFGLLIGWWKGIDIRAHGSGNIGATNVGRVLGRGWGLFCFGLDLLKGLGPVLAYAVLEGGLVGEGVSGSLAGLGVAVCGTAGHVLPVWLKFKGGKGVATGLGVMLGLWPVVTGPAVVVGLIWLGVTWWWGYVSLGSVVAAALLPVLACVSAGLLGASVDEVVVFGAATGLLAGLVVVKHRANLARLRAGTESRVGWGRRGAL